MPNCSTISLSLMPGIDMDVFMHPHQEYDLEQKEKVNYKVGKNLSTKLTIPFGYLEAPASILTKQLKCPIVINLTLWTH